MIATNSPVNHDKPDDLDRALGTFFRGEVPTPWPPLSAPVKTPVTVRDTGTLSAGRMALAASVAALLVGGWFLSGRLTSPISGMGSLENGGATLPRDLQHGGPQPSHRHP